MTMTRWLVTILALASLGGPALAATSFQVSFPRSVEPKAQTGRLLIVVRPASPGSADVEPRDLIGLRAPGMFGSDVEGLKPDELVTLDASATGYPMENLAKLPAGDYNVQAVLIRYTLTNRSDGHAIWVPITDAQVPAWVMPGNLFSKPQKLRLDAAVGYNAALSLTEKIPAIATPPDTQWVKHVRIKSRVLSDFWGVPMYFGANVLLPKGFDANPKVRYPAVYAFGHGATPFSMNTDPASHEKDLASSRDANVQTGYEFYQTWNSDRLPRMVAVTLHLPSPYFLESYAVNSPNNGPWGDAITQELLPYLEKKFRLIAQPYARVLEGASTGGWEALASQLQYPDVFGGAWVFNPDPIDFTRYQLVDIYKDENMFSLKVTPSIDMERPFRRNREGQPLYTMRQLSRLEAVLGSHGRSSYQLAIWQSTHGPVGEDGYPKPLFDPLTGVIDRSVVHAMRENGYDLAEFTRRNWPALGPKLVGKLHFFAGEQDDFFLNLGVYQFEDMLKTLPAPAAEATFAYGRPKKGHNWHLTDFSEMLRQMADHIARNAPAGENTDQWRY